MANGTTIRKSAVEALAGKLEVFAASLPEQEQNVLGWILSRAQETGTAELSESQLESVAGGQGVALSRQLADSVGFSGVETAGESEISTTWKYSHQ
jgi:hypothetical protein